MNSLHKQLNVWIKVAVASGWRVDQSGGGHFKFYPRDKSKPIVCAPSTPSDWRGMLNCRAHLRRSGLNV